MIPLNLFQQINLVIFLSLLGCILLRYIYIKYISNLRDVPGPILGKMSSFYVKHFITKGNYHEFLKQIHDQYGPVVHFAPNRVMINTKKSSNIIYGTYSYKKAPFYRAFDYGAGNIFSVADKEVHSERRKIVAQTISSSNLKQLEPVMIEYGFLPLKKKLKELYETNGHCDIYKLIHQVLFTINGQLILSENLDLLNSSESDLPILKWLKEAQIYGIMQYEFPILKTIGGERFGKKSYQQFIQFCKSKIEERQQLLAQMDTSSDLTEYNDILQSFLTNSREPLTLDDLAAEIITGFIAGTDTTANTLTWTLKLLIENPDKLDKLQQEIDQLYKENSIEAINYELIKKNCPYLEACISESMRLYPIGAGFLPRMTPKGGVELEGYYLPEDLEVGIGSYAYHRSSEIWENSDQFIPERFLDSSVRSNYLPFLIGPRSCVGREFAWLAMSHFLTCLLYYFEIEYYNKNAKVTPYFFLVLKPKESEMVISIKPRNELNV